MTETLHGRIALTGAAGRIGTVLRPLLAPRCRELVLIDRQDITLLSHNERAHALDLQDRPALQEALAGCDAVVHFAGHPREAPWDVLLAANIVGTINLWESALAQGVQRIVYASSNHAVGFYPRTERLHERVAPRADGRYGVTKVFMESLAAMHAVKHGLRAFGLRIGHCSQAPKDARMLSHWIHPEDLAALIEIGLRADYVEEVVYGASDNSASWWPNARARALGYAPRHCADAFASALAHLRSDDPVAEHYQGGAFAAEDYRRGALR